MVDDAALQGAPADLIELGRIVAAHGVRGQVKIQPHDVGSGTLIAQRVWWLQAAALTPLVSPPRPVRVLNCKRHGDVLVAQLEGVADRDQAQALKGATLHLPRSVFPKAADDEYYWVDLIGCALYGKDDCAQDVLLGRITQVSDNGAHALLHVRKIAPEDAARARSPEQLIPFVAAHILRVSLPERRIDSNWPADF